MAKTKVEQIFFQNLNTTLNLLKVLFWWKKLSRVERSPAYLRVTAGFATCRVRYMFATTYTGMQICYLLHSTNFATKVSERVVNISTTF